MTSFFTARSSIARASFLLPLREPNMTTERQHGKDATMRAYSLLPPRSAPFAERSINKHSAIEEERMPTRIRTPGWQSGEVVVRNGDHDELPMRVQSLHEFLQGYTLCDVCGTLWNAFIKLQGQWYEEKNELWSSQAAPLAPPQILCRWWWRTSSHPTSRRRPAQYERTTVRTSYKTKHTYIGTFFSSEWEKTMTSSHSRARANWIAKWLSSSSSQSAIT